MPQTIPDNPYEIIDLTPPLQPHLVRWPGDEPLQLIQTRTLAGGDSCNASVLTISVHAGAHVDAPCHFMKEGAGVDELPLEILTGPARGADVGRAARL
ncbi:MAG: cyclase family protein, partial [Planctomycetes bacterium]|nr:cyclase family protein [Planctomycetota bacterium]